MGYLACARTVPCTHPSSSSCAPSHTQGGGSRPMSARWLGALQLWHCGLADRVDARVDPSRVSSARYASGGVNRATANDLPISCAAGSLLSCTYPAVVKTTCEHPVAVPRRRARSLVWTANSPRRSGGGVLGVGAAQEQNKPTAGAPTNHVLWIALQRERRQSSLA